MHIHGTEFNVQAASLSGAGSYRAENAERSAQTRRRLLKAARTLDATDIETADPEASLLVGAWLNVRHNHALAEDEYTPDAVPGPGQY